MAGTLAGLLGVGGGIIIVPLLLSLFESRGYNPDSIIHMASGTSLATISITSLSSAHAHNKRGAVHWDIIKRLLPGIAMGALAGAYLAHRIPGRYLEILFGVFEIMVAARIFSGKRGERERGVSDTSWLLFLGGGVIGTLSSMLGVGGGTLVVPFLIWLGLSVREAVGTAAASGFPLAVFGSAGFLVLGMGVPGLPEVCLGYIHIPAFITISLATFFSAPYGAQLAHTLPANILKTLFSLLLLLLGLSMFWGVGPD